MGYYIEADGTVRSEESVREEIEENKKEASLKTADDASIKVKIYGRPQISSSEILWKTVRDSRRKRHKRHSSASHSNTFSISLQPAQVQKRTSGQISSSGLDVPANQEKPRKHAKKLKSVYNKKTRHRKKTWKPIEINKEQIEISSNTKFILIKNKKHNP